jgi:hypothetical protein
MLIGGIKGHGWLCMHACTIKWQGNCLLDAALDEGITSAKRSTPVGDHHVRSCTCAHFLHVLIKEEVAHLPCMVN